MSDQKAGGGLEIPMELLSPAILRALIEEFVLREGTEYGAREYTLDEKVAEVEKQLRKGLAKILFDADTESCTIVPARTLR